MFHHPAEDGGMKDEQARRQALQAMLRALADAEGELLDALHHDLGKSPSEAYVSELEGVRSECRHALAHLHRWMKPERRKLPPMAWPGRAVLHREPCGSVLVISPWNYPVFLSLTPVACALAAGCSVVLKPSERAPRVAEVLDRMMAGAFPSGLVSVIVGDGGTAKELLKKRFDHFFFTGSRGTGLEVAAAAARHGVPATLELGGKCPVMMFSGGGAGGTKLRDRLDTAARRIAWGKYLNAGQTCVAPDHVLVERDLYEPLLDALKRAFDSFGRDGYGKMVDRRHFDRVRAYLGQGTIFHGGVVDEATLSISPTILTDVADDAGVMKEEIFGPVLPVIPCDDLEDGLRRARANPDPLAVYPFTEDAGVVERIRAELRSGAVCVNDVVVHVAGVDLPFGGTGNSGMGRYRGRAGFDAFSRERIVLNRGLRWDLPFRYPPLPDLKNLKRALKIFGA
ncbi:aldehyde dehydrogenase family protein [Luteolibacter sp. SL250]|uniref:aldehyde dehydrogenase family protein n=1 Tax=Luteolibacter sp. SL250 TaxID=2995170 RepID=UPI00226E3150|nr:aldehyde dehydrogenase family protein [Luteolibacter sp. SL250]WAC21116.1 aldehyde dehydrogenase family protein [Luteolibacter sp. SL250]